MYCFYKPMSEILVDRRQNNVLPLVTLIGIFFLAPKLHFILVTAAKVNMFWGWGLDQGCDPVPSWGSASPRWEVGSLGTIASKNWWVLVRGPRLGAPASGDVSPHRRWVIPPVSLAVDVNECLDPTTCISGNCVNTPGSYTCDCPPDFELNPTRVGCVGKTLNTCLSHALFIILKV